MQLVLEPGLEKEVAAIGPLVNKRRRKRGNDEAEANAPPKVMRKDHAAFRPTQSTLEGKSLALIGLDASSTFSTVATHDAPTTAKIVSDLDPPSYAKPQLHPELDIAQESGVKEINLLPLNGRVAMRSHSTAEVSMGLQLRIRFKQEVRLLKKATAKIAKQDQRIQAREEEIKKLDQKINSLRAVEVKVHDLHNQKKNLETLLEAEVDMKKAAEAKNAELAKELESLYVQVEQCCAKMDARQDKLSVDFGEELYLHRLTAITIRLVKGMSKGLKHCIEHGKADRDLAAVKAYDPKADSKYVKALQDLKDLKYPLVDQLEILKDAPMELIMASLHSESDTREDAPSGSVTFALAPPN
nr:hypothetical protein [Tanacetum cinerariifolium]